jgi:hypothetical protein
MRITSREAASSPRRLCRFCGQPSPARPYACGVRTETDALLSLQRHVAAALPDLDVYTELEAEQPDRPFAIVTTDGEWTAAGLRATPDVTLPVTVYVYVEGNTRTAARKAAEDAREALWDALAVGDRPNAETLVPLFDYSGRPAVQQVTITGATSGTWRLFYGAWTLAIPRRAQPRQVRLALEAATPALVGDVWVYGSLGGPYAVRFDGTLRGQPVEDLIGDPTGLVGPGPAVEVAVLSEGAPEPWRSDRDYMRATAPTFGGLPDPSDARLRTVTVGLRLTWARFGHVRSGEMKVRTITARPL